MFSANNALWPVSMEIAADHFTPLENERFETTLRKIARGDERVVAATDKSYALSDGHD